MLNPQPLAEAQQSAATRFFSLSSGLLDGVHSLVQLNVQAAKALSGEAAQAVVAALSAQSPQDLVAVQAAWLQAAPEKAAAYLGHVKSIAEASGAEARQYWQTAASGAQAELAHLVDAAAKNAPAGAENAVALVKTAVTAATQAIEAAVAPLQATAA